MSPSMRTFLPLALLLLASFACFGQAKKTGVLEAGDLKTVLPTNYYFDGQVASVQNRNAGAVRFDNGKLLVAAFVDNSGYSSDVAAKYQGLLITDASVVIGDKDLAPGQYGFGFMKDGTFIVLNIAADEVFHVSFQQDENLKRPVPLKIVAAEGGYRLYAGKKYVTIKAK